MDTVLLLGDSIRMGYCARVRELLSGRAFVVWPDDNYRFTLYTLRYLREWTEALTNPNDVRVVHWNNGLWDISRHTADGLNLVPVREYGNNLVRILRQIRAVMPRAKVVFATTTPVGTLPHIYNAEVDAYNAEALRVMAEHNISINDLHSAITGHAEFIADDNIHMTCAGYNILATRVAAYIEARLGN